MTDSAETASAAAPLALTTARLRLRAHRREDATALHAIYRRPEVARHLLDEPWSAAQAATRVEERLGHTDLAAEDGALAVVIEHDGAVIGDVLLWLTDREHRLGEIGWVLDPAYSGRGLAAEAVAEVLRWGFTQHRLHRIVAQMDTRNTASARLAERVGMVQEAHLRQNWWSKGEWTDTLIFARLRKDQVRHEDQVRPERQLPTSRDRHSPSQHLKTQHLKTHHPSPQHPAT